MWPFRPRYTLTVHKAESPLAGWFVRATARNGEILWSSETYTRHEDAVRAAEQLVRARFKLSPVVRAARPLPQID